MNTVFKKTHKNVYKWLEIILAERFNLTISLSEQENHTVLLMLENSNSFITLPSISKGFFSIANNLSCTQWDAQKEGWVSVLGNSLAAPGFSSLTSPLIEQHNTSYTINYDILGFTYWMLTRQEEINSTKLDQYDRFPATASHAYQYGYLDKPIVDEWLNILGQVMLRLWPRIELKQHIFNMKVSHDVDTPSSYGFVNGRELIRTIGIDVIIHHNYKSLWLGPWVRANTRKQLYPMDPNNTFDWIMNISEQHGLSSAFYFMCGRTDASKDADYEPEHPAIRKLMCNIHQRGHEIGLHPSFNTYQKPQLIVQEAKRLKRICKEEGIEQENWGGRMHFLRWDHPTTLYGWEAAGMQYDSTFSYADLPGFRCGTCFEYTAFDPIKEKIINLRIRPLIAMECTIINDRYMGLGHTKESLKTFLSLKETCRKVAGCFTLLWHNSEFTTEQDKQLYQAIIE